MINCANIKDSFAEIPIIRLAKDNYSFWMQLAEQVSYSSKVKRFKLGAVLVKRGKLLATACNQYKTHPKFGSNLYKTLHAEGAVIYRALLAGHDLTGTKLFIYRTNRNPSSPCEDCMHLIQFYKISEVYCF